MAIVKKFDLSGKEIGTVQINDDLLDLSAHPQMVKDYIVAIRNNARQWSANTKGRKEVNRTGKKPHPQKGQGRSRQGCLAAPQYKGGGIVFGPKPKFDQHVRINKRERQAVIRFLLAEKIKANQLHVLKSEKMAKPKTKIVVDFLKAVNLIDHRVLFLDTAEKQEELYLSLRNLPKKEYSFLFNINGYNLALCRDVVIMDSALDQLLTILG
ncbi:MAG: ribosomal protein [Parachlamydiales bacterium]|nr:ribosomal protein [Parachlamydiales bacterium]